MPARKLRHNHRRKQVFRASQYHRSCSCSRLFLLSFPITAASLVYNYNIRHIHSFFQDGKFSRIREHNGIPLYHLEYNKLSHDESFLFFGGSAAYYHYNYLQRPTQEVARTRMAPRIVLVYDWAWVGKESGLTRKLKNGVLRVWAEQRRFWVTEIPLLANSSSDTYVTSRVSY